MKKKTAPLNFSNVCGIRTYLALSIKGEIKLRRETVTYWGASSAMAKMHNQRVRDMVRAYRAAKNIQIQY
jgi:hypothetical protein